MTKKFIAAFMLIPVLLMSRLQADTDTDTQEETLATDDIDDTEYFYYALFLNGAIFDFFAFPLEWQVFGSFFSAAELRQIAQNITSELMLDTP